MGKYRKITQWFFFVLMFIVPVLNMLEIYFIKGTYISMDIGALAVSDPLAVLQAVFASHEVKAVMITSAALPVIIAILLGRVWCSWACPYYLILDGIETLRRKLKLKSLKPSYSEKGIARANLFRYATLIVGFILVGIAGVPLLYLISPPSVISSQAVMLLKHFTLTAEFIFIPLVLIVETFFVYRFWCRFFCPTGTVLGLFRSPKGMRVEYLGECSGCTRCVKICPMVLDPRKDAASSQCHNCGECVRACPDNKKTDTLKFKIK